MAKKHTMIKQHSSGKGAFEKKVENPKKKNRKSGRK